MPLCNIENLLKSLTYKHTYILVHTHARTLEIGLILKFNSLMNRRSSFNLVDCWNAFFYEKNKQIVSFSINDMNICKNIRHKEGKREIA